MITHQTDFSSKNARLNYWFFVFATFCIFVSCLTIVYFAPVLLNFGFSHIQIGNILAAGAPPVAICALLSGSWATKFGALFLVRLGAVVTLAGFFTLQLGANSTSVLISSSGVGIMSGGYGFFITAAYFYVRSLVMPRRLMRYVGIYSAMLQLPLLLSSYLAEQIFIYIGGSAFFYLCALPLIFGLIILFIVRNEVKGTQHHVGNSHTYFQAFMSGLPWKPYAAGATAAFLFGSVNVFGSLALTSLRLPIIYFFGAFTAGFILMRFLVLSLMESIPKHILTSTGLFLMVAGISVSLLKSANGVICGGFVFGFGYGILYPICTVWISETTNDSYQVKALAIFNALFTFCVHGSPIFAGATVENFGVRGLIFSLLSIGVVVLSFMLLPFNRFCTRYRAPQN